jgi:hypothetical protein
MRVGYLDRDVDSSGVSGTGMVAELVEFTDGTVVLRWLGPLSSTAMHASLANLSAIHGHRGDTRVVWLACGQAELPRT